VPQRRASRPVISDQSCIVRKDRARRNTWIAEHCAEVPPATTVSQFTAVPQRRGLKVVRGMQNHREKTRPGSRLAVANGVTTAKR